MGIIECVVGYGVVMEVWWLGDLFDGFVVWLVFLVDVVFVDVEVGVYFCYGDVGEKYFFELVDVVNFVWYVNVVIVVFVCLFIWLYLLVLIVYDDEVYFVLFVDFILVEELYFGFVYCEDGVEGVECCIDVVCWFVFEFGVVIECGIGCVFVGLIEGILCMYVEVVVVW